MPGVPFAEKVFISTVMTTVVLFFFDELGPPWTKHPCTIGDRPAAFLNGQLPSDSSQPMRHAQGWKPLRSAQFFEIASGRYGVMGYSGGNQMRYELEGVSSEIAQELQTGKKAIWHFRATPSHGEIPQAGVYTPTDRFYSFGLTPLKADILKVFPSAAVSSKKPDVVSRNIDITEAANFSRTRFLARPNATCSSCYQGVYLYHNPSATGFLKFDNEGPPWTEHVCKSKEIHMQRNLDNWQRLVFNRFEENGAAGFRIIGHSKGNPIALKIPSVDNLLIKKLTEAYAVYYHYRNNSDGTLTLGIYIAGESFMEISAS